MILCTEQIASEISIYLQHVSAAGTLKAHTHRPIFRGFLAELAVESADSIPESADYTTDSEIVGRLPLSNVSNIYNPLELTDGKLA